MGHFASIQEKNMASELIPEINKIPFDPDQKRNPMVFKHYQPEKQLMGKTMKDHLRFAVAYWHTFRAAGMDPVWGGHDFTALGRWQ